MSVASVQLIKDFNLKGVSAPEFFRSAEDIERYAGRHPYSHLMRRAWEAMHLNGILCVDDRPTVYFKEVEHISSTLLRALYQKFWNQGLATLLVVKSATDVQVFSSLAEPARENEAVSDKDRLVETLEITATFLQRVETGQIYRQYPEKFKPEKAIDKFLLKNLSTARNLLRKHNKLDYKIIHALLGRIIFTCYLIERKIINGKQFAEAGAGCQEPPRTFRRLRTGQSKRQPLQPFWSIAKTF